jgi:rhodanese-related sulfurtransferase
MKSRHATLTDSRWVSGHQIDVKPGGSGAELGNVISAQTLRGWLHDGAELALLDVREAGQTILGHILFSAPLPFSRFEAGLQALAPNPRVRVVLCDAGDGVAERAAARAAAMGYTQVFCLAGGVSAWAEAGHTLYQGVNVPSKAFGELVEHAADTPRMGAAQVAEMQGRNPDMVIVDGRPLEEFAKMSIPGASCCPNGELALRISGLAPDPATTIIVNCAGRTRSIIGAQTLIDMGVPNPVYAMENGTQGWVLAGLELDHGRVGALPEMPGGFERQRANASALAARHDVRTVTAGTLGDWLGEDARTVFLLDVRTEDERLADPAGRTAMMEEHGVMHAPGGQLVQATDQWIGVRNARVVVLDTEDVRAPVAASWLRRLGHDAVTLADGLDGLQDVVAVPRASTFDLPDLTRIAPADLSARIREPDIVLLDLRSSCAFSAGHIPGAVWSIRPRIAPIAPGSPVVLVADTETAAGLVACDLIGSGVEDIGLLAGGMEAWQGAGLPVDETPGEPPDAERIDFQSFTHGRHDGNREASEQYLAWEIALVDQLDAQERAVFQI